MSAKKVTTFRLSEDVLDMLDKITKVTNEYQKKSAAETGIVVKDLSKADILEILIKERYQDMF